MRQPYFLFISVYLWFCCVFLVSSFLANAHTSTAIFDRPAEFQQIQCNRKRAHIESNKMHIRQTISVCKRTHFWVAILLDSTFFTVALSLALALLYYLLVIFFNWVHYFSLVLWGFNVSQKSSSCTRIMGMNEIRRSTNNNYFYIAAAAHVPCAIRDRVFLYRATKPIFQWNRTLPSHFPSDMIPLHNVPTVCLMFDDPLWSYVLVYLLRFRHIHFCRATYALLSWCIPYCTFARFILKIRIKLPTACQLDYLNSCLVRSAIYTLGFRLHFKSLLGNRFYCTNSSRHYHWMVISGNWCTFSVEICAFKWYSGRFGAFTQGCTFKNSFFHREFLWR